MTITQITPQYSVSPQIGPEDVTDIAARGFRAIMCNRPDGESPDQPDVLRISEAAKAEGLEFAFVPVVSGAMTPADVERFRAALDGLPGPVLAYCRSGTRCTQLWQLSR